MVQIDFNAEDYEPTVAFDPIAPGWYEAWATSATIKTNDSGWTGISVEFEIRSGPQAGRKVWTNITQAHTSEKAVAIGKAQLSALCRSIGKLRVTDTDDLLMAPVLIKVTIRPAKDGRDANNDVREFKPISAATGAPAPTAPAATVRPVATTTAPAWKR